jgi:hypothetical protein
MPPAADPSSDQLRLLPVTGVVPLGATRRWCEIDLDNGQSHDEGSSTGHAVQFQPA